MAQEINTHRVLTIAGSVALVALTAYGVWKWNKTDVKNEDDKKKKTRQVEKQSHSTEVKAPKESVETVSIVEEQVVLKDETVLVEVVELTEEVKVSEPVKQEVVEPVVVKETVVEPVVVKQKEVEPVVVKQKEVEPVVVKQTEVEPVVVKQTEVEPVKQAEVEQVLVEAEQVLTEINKVVTETIKEEEEEYVVVAKREESQSCATSSTEETDVWTPEHESDNHKHNTPEATPITTTDINPNEEYIWKADATPTTTHTEEEKDWASSTIVSCSKLSSDAPVFVPRQQMKKNPKKRLSRAELIEQQRQNHTPHAKARCSHWPRCTNKNCKFWHPFRDCREGETCPFGNKCMFIHPSDYVEPPRVKKNQISDEEEQFIQHDQFQFTA